MACSSERESAFWRTQALTSTVVAAEDGDDEAEAAALAEGEGDAGPGADEVVDGVDEAVPSGAEPPPQPAARAPVRPSATAAARRRPGRVGPGRGREVTPRR